MTDNSTESEELIGTVGTRLYTAAVQITVVGAMLTVFLGLAFMTYRGAIESGPLLLVAGGVLGYLAHVGKTVF
jgi:hypothetical protein